LLSCSACPSACFNSRPTTPPLLREWRWPGQLLVNVTLSTEGIWLYKDGGKDAKDCLRKDEAMSLGDVDCLPEIDWRLGRHVPYFSKTSCLFVLGVFTSSQRHQRHPKTGLPFSWLAKATLNVLRVYGIANCWSHLLISHYRACFW
jgi:hypothetical protein